MSLPYTFVSSNLIVKFKHFILCRQTNNLKSMIIKFIMSNDELDLKLCNEIDKINFFTYKNYGWTILFSFIILQFV